MKESGVRDNFDIYLYFFFVKRSSCILTSSIKYKYHRHIKNDLFLLFPSGCGRIFFLLLFYPLNWSLITNFTDLQFFIYVLFINENSIKRTFIVVIYNKNHFFFSKVNNFFFIIWKKVPGNRSSFIRRKIKYNVSAILYSTTLSWYKLRSFELVEIYWTICIVPLYFIFGRKCIYALELIFNEHPLYIQDIEDIRWYNIYKR